jgi:hypothetical protein
VSKVSVSTVEAMVGDDNALVCVKAAIIAVVLVKLSQLTRSGERVRVK